MEQQNPLRASKSEFERLVNETFKKSKAYLSQRTHSNGEPEEWNGEVYKLVKDYSPLSIRILRKIKPLKKIFHRHIEKVAEIHSSNKARRLIDYLNAGEWPEIDVKIEKLFDEQIIRDIERFAGTYKSSSGKKAVISYK